MNEQLSQLSERFGKYFRTIGAVTGKYRFTLIFLIASSAVMFALLQSRAYLNPERNETRYDEERLKINYSSVDQEIVNKLSATQNDQSIEVDQSLVPDRSNPFAE